MEEKCDNCKFFGPPTKSEGSCKRYPPVQTSVFVYVKRDSWCGEFILRVTEMPVVS